jgi:hypothetical protein
MNANDKVREARLRRWAKRLNLSLRKDRHKHWSVNCQGGYMILDPNRNTIVYGQNFEMDLDGVETKLQEIEQAS